MKREKVTVGVLKRIIQMHKGSHWGLPPVEITLGVRAARDLYWSGRRTGYPINWTNWAVERTHLGLIEHTMIYFGRNLKRDEVQVLP